MSPIAPVEPINRVNASRYVVTHHSCQGLTTNPCAEPDRRCIRSFDYMVVSDVLCRSGKSLLARLTHVSMTRLPRCSPVGSHAYSFRGGRIAETLWIRVNQRPLTSMEHTYKAMLFACDILLRPQPIQSYSSTDPLPLHWQVLYCLRTEPLLVTDRHI